MRIVPVKLGSQGNPRFPLPPEYFKKATLESERRAMRVNATRQWQLYTPPPGCTLEERRVLLHKQGEAMCGALSFFDKYYLCPLFSDDGNVLFDPGFYDQDPCATPEYHWHLCRARRLARLVAAVGPRGSAKTKYMQKTVQLQMLSRHNYSFLYITSMQELSEEFGEEVKFSLYNNERIFNDFAPEEGFNGRIAPKRGEARTGMASFSLTNRSRIFCSSAEARKRGKRPWEVLIDDAEWDPKAATSPEILRAWFSHMLFRLVLPMIQRSRSKLLWLGTFTSQQSYLWHIMQNRPVTLPSGEVVDLPIDPRFKRWYRLLQPAAVERDLVDPETKEVRRVRVSCWPDMWPVDEAEKKARGLPPDTQSLEDIEEELGPAAFQAEMMGNPEGGIAAYFPLLERDKHGYWYEQHDVAFDDTPFASNTKICWWRRDELIKMSLADFCARFTRFACLDASDTETTDSDYKTCLMMAMTNFNELFVLDIWGAQTSEEAQVLNAFQQADRWRCEVLAPEAVRGSGVSLAKSLEDVVHTKAMAELGVEHLPYIMPLKVGMMSKCAKIAAMKRRFEHGLVKLPFDFQHVSSTPWPMLFNQIHNFKNIGGDNTGLYKDDFLDTLSMHRFVVKALPSGEKDTPPAQSHTIQSIVAELRAGRTQDPKTGMSYVALAFPYMRPEDVDAILDAKRTRQAQEQFTEVANDSDA